MNKNLRAASVALVATALLSGCSRPAHDTWKPTAAPSAVDLATFTSRYQPVIASIASATAASGFTWSSAQPSTATVSKNGFCSWRLEQQGTYTPNGQSARDVRNTINRVLVANGFHASALDRSNSTAGASQDVMSSIDSHVALLEVTLTTTPTIDVYSPAPGKTC